MASGAAARIRKNERGVDPAADQPQHRDGLIQVDRSSPLGCLPIALDLRRYGRTQPQPAHDDLLGELLEPVFDGSIEVSEGLEQAEWNEGRNGGLGHGFGAEHSRESGWRKSHLEWLDCLSMAGPAAPGRSFDDEALPHLDALYRVALRLTADASQAEDLVQDTMLKAYRSWKQYRPGTNAKGWLLTILRNTFINDYRRRKHEPIAMDLEAVEPHIVDRSIQEADPEGTFFSQIVDERVLEAIDALPDEFREVLALSDIEGLRYAEIAEMLQIPVGTVKSRLFRARRLLQQELYSHAVEMGYIQPRESPT
jgi:RNA polymerase sigma-70 factor, ECF subfamily